MKNTRTIEVWVYTRKMDDSEMPISAENAQNRSCAVAGFRRLMPKEMTNTIASGARMKTHFSGLTNIATPNEVSMVLPTRAAAAPASVVTAPI